MLVVSSSLLLLVTSWTGSVLGQVNTEIDQFEDLLAVDSFDNKVYWLNWSFYHLLSMVQNLFRSSLQSHLWEKLPSEKSTINSTRSHHSGIRLPVVTDFQNQGKPIMLVQLCSETKWMMMEVTASDIKPEMVCLERREVRVRIDWWYKVKWTHYL